MLGLVAGTASFAQTASTPQANLLITLDQKVKLLVAPAPGMARLELKDADGRVLYTERHTQDKGIGKVFNIDDLADGTYYLNIRTANGQTETKTIVVQNAHRVVSV